MNTQIILSGTSLKHEPEWIEVPAGNFIMGSNEADREAFHDEMPQHIATINAPYLIASTPITNAQYKVFVQDTGHPTLKHGNNEDVCDCPVTYISWYDALAFCKWLTQEMQKAKRFQNENNLYVTLPNEAQWERAARGTNGQRFTWGNNAPNVFLLNYNRRDGSPTPVGSYPSGISPVGCLDMAGNVWEWTLDTERKYPYIETENQESLGIQQRRILRGGSYESSERSVRCAVRSWNYPEERDETVGFRVVII